MFSRNSAAADGGGLEFRSVTGAMAVTGTTLEDNVAGGCGGGLAMTNAGPALQLDTSRLARNAAANGGGVCVRATGPSLAHASLAHITVEGNSASGLGGGLALLAGANVTIIGGSVTGNTAPRGGGLHAGGGGLVAYLTFARNALAENNPAVRGSGADGGASTAGSGGAAVSAERSPSSGTRLMLRGLVVEEHVFSGSQSIIRLGTNASVDLVESRLANNRAPTAGSAVVYVGPSSDSTLSMVTISENYGTALLLGGTLGAGAAANIHFVSNNGSTAGAGIACIETGEPAGIVLTGSSRLCGNVVLGLANVTHQQVSPTCMAGAVVDATGDSGLFDCPATCGNGIIEDGEDCDDYNLIAGDGCAKCATESGWECAGGSTGEPSRCELLPPAAVGTAAALASAADPASYTIAIVTVIFVALAITTLIKRRKVLKVSSLDSERMDGLVPARNVWAKLRATHAVVGMLVMPRGSADPYSRGGRLVALALSSGAMLVAVVTVPLTNASHFAQVAETTGGRILVFIASLFVGWALSLVFGTPVMRALLRSRSARLERLRGLVFVGGIVCAAAEFAFALVVMLAGSVVGVAASYSERFTTSTILGSWIGCLLVRWVIFDTVAAFVQFYIWRDVMVWPVAKRHVVAVLSTNSSGGSSSLITPATSGKRRGVSMRELPTQSTSEYVPSTPMDSSTRPSLSSLFDVEATTVSGGEQGQ
ncbi:uncharacterized protein AMSG_02878 [Thecamonas trahens ATCC 50062]|uniref:DUF4215 domain-containing protein n=1 Tax=Thecamonas trahens ATCC 50062 TaxID=461836 RepID=A0A0L0D247_THETB|nr:hypothetical protein AMSG_02878 [Thecamonas trahens ATCC 50062]KNC46424.1 hypothetical protein AMSG_02878 [Thecamonas trahens ATCC 50062]|eukprot:XP_013760715.1 hypothetical protein AMSG_02878 [Thecamonas trahens ATCC 50062]